jgi:O-acetyl-ADP-ribose deacetylase (regulator of RNase III)
MLLYQQKDITTVTKGIILQGCNAQGVMGSGVAKAIRDKWPGVFAGYKQMCDKKAIKSELMGNCSIYDVPDLPVVILNSITQEWYGRDGKVYADKNAIDTAMLTACLVADSEPNPPVSIYLPKIGCGLGGLSWDLDIKPIVESYAAAYPMYDFIVCEV